MKRTIRNIYRWTSVLLILLFFLSVLASRINPNDVPFLAFFGLVFPFIAMVNILFFLAHLKFNRILAIVSGLVIFLSIPQISKMFALNIGQGKKEGAELKIMTYNVRNFDLYNWSNNQASRDEILRTIREQDADIICFQEFFNQMSGSFQNIEALKAMGYRHFVFSRELVLRDRDEWGIAVFSRFPIVGQGEFLKQKEPTGYGKYPHRGLYTDIDLGEDTIRVVTVHLQSIYLKDDDYRTISEVKDNREVDLQGSGRILGKVKKAFRKRGLQADEIVEFLRADNSLPTIFTGDFNDTPYSYSYQQIARGFKDAFMRGGSGFGTTYNGPLPGLRIDYILVSKEFRVHGSSVVSNAISDHFPLVAEVSLTQ